MPPSPQYTQWAFANHVVNDPRFAQLSPQSQQVFRALSDPAAARGAVTVPPDVYAQAYSEARSKGLDPFDPTALYVVGGLTGYGLATGLLGGAGVASGAGGSSAAGGEFAGSAAPAAGVGIGETSATTGLAGSGFGPAVLPSAATVPTAGVLPAGASPIGPSALATGTGVGTTAATTGSGLWQTINGLSPLIQAGTNLGGAAIAASANKDAAAAQLKAAEEAIAAQKELYAQQRADLGPYRNLGYGAITNLRGLTGMPPEAMPSPYTALGPSTSGEQVPGWSAPQYAGPGATVQTWQGPGRNPMYASPQDIAAYQAQQAPGPSTAPTVRMRAPDQSVRDVPSELVNSALQAGAVRV